MSLADDFRALADRLDTHPIDQIRIWEDGKIDVLIPAPTGSAVREFAAQEPTVPVEEHPLGSDSLRTKAVREFGQVNLYVYSIEKSPDD